MGRVRAICIADGAREPMRTVGLVRAIEGVGLDGDRYAVGEGSFSDGAPEGRQVTLIEAEAIEAASRQAGIELDPSEARRNLVTEGVALNELVGHRFTIGGVELVGVRLCHPCRDLEEMTRPGVMRALEGRGGLRADIVTGGEIRVGDRIEV